MDTNACIAHFTATTDLPPNMLEQAIPEAIDAVYEARDSGKYMHEAGASAAVATLEAIDVNALIDALDRLMSPKWRDELIESHDNWMHRAKWAEHYLEELLGLILDDMSSATNRDLAADGNVGDEEGEVWGRIEKLAAEARAAAAAAFTDEPG